MFCWVLIVIILGQAGTVSAEIKTSGYLQHYLISNPHYFYPANNDWIWELWNGRTTWGGGSNISPTTPAALGGARLGLTLSIGNQRSPFYLYMPMLFYSTAYYNQGMAQLQISSGSSYFAVQVKGDRSAVSLTSQGLRFRTPWTFSSLGDPLGALKLPNTPDPALTFKVTSSLPFGWEVTGYYLADNRCNFIPMMEEIPQTAYTALGVTPQTMLFYDETPSYVMGRATKQISSNLTLGLIWGEKQAINILPRSEDEQIGNPRNPTHGVGYKKINYGFDLSGSIPFGTKANFVIAAVDSEGEWQQQKRGSDGVIQAVDLGKIRGSALKIELTGLQIGNTSISGNFNHVTPGFQLIAARNSRYAYTRQFNSTSRPSISYCSWKPVLDEDFIIRDPNQKEAYLSDVASYLGLRASQLQIDVPGKIRAFANSFPSKWKLKTSLIENQRSESFYDPFTWKEQESGYLELASILEVNQNYNRLNFFAINRSYEQKISIQNWHNLRQELGLEFGSEKQEGLNYRGFVSKIWRSNENDGLDSGESQQLSFQLKSRTSSGMYSETGFSYQTGNYTDDIKGMRDRVLSSRFSLLSINQYFELVNTFNIGSSNVRARIAGEALYRTSDLPNVSGTSLVGYTELKSNLTHNISATVTFLGIKGPKAIDGFASKYLNNTIDYSLIYRPFGSSENSIELNFTRRYMEEGLKTNWYLRWNTRKGRHMMSLTYGYRPTNENRIFVAGTPYDVRFSLPVSETINRPWNIWREQAIYSDQTFTNYFLLSWVLRF